MEGEKKGLKSKHRRLGYAGLILCLACLLIAFHWISGSVPVLRTQKSAVRSPKMRRLDENGVTAILNSSPSAPQLLEYDFRSEKLDLHSLVDGNRFLFGETGERYLIDRKPSKYKSQSEAVENAVANANAGKSVASIWRATTFDKKWSPQSVVYFELPEIFRSKPILLLQHFAVLVGHQSVHVVDLESERRELRTFPFSMEGGSILSTARIGNNRIAQARELGVRRIIDLFEIASDGDVALIKSWGVGAGWQPKSANAVIDSSSVTFNHFGDRIYSQSASENRIEEHSLSGELISSFEIPGRDLSKDTWSFHGSYIRWEGTGFDWRYFDLETRTFLKIPENLFGQPFGRVPFVERNLAIHFDFIDSLSVPQITVFDRTSGEVVGSWPYKPYHSYSIFKDGDRTEILATGFEWGLSLTKHNIQDGAVLETHFPLRPWFVGINVLAASVLGWSFAWLYFAARSGGNAWLDIYLVSGVLIGIGLWRLGTTGFPFALDRLPYDYLTGIYFGLLAVIIFKLMEAPHSEKNRLAHLCVVLPFGSLLIVYLLYARIPPREGMLAISFGPMAPAEPTILGILAVMTSMLMVVCFFLHALHYFRTQDTRSFYKSFFRFPHFSIRDLLWVIVLMALLCVTLKYSPSTLRYFTNPPWAWVIANSALTTAAMAIALVLGSTQKTKISRIGWVMTFVVLCILLGEFAFDFANGKPPPFSIPFSGDLPGRWRIGRAILTGSVVAFVFSRRFSMMRSHSWQE